MTLAFVTLWVVALSVRLDLWIVDLLWTMVDLSLMVWPLLCGSCIFILVNLYLGIRYWTCWVLQGACRSPRLAVAWRMLCFLMCWRKPVLLLASSRSQESCMRRLRGTPAAARGSSKLSLRSAWPIVASGQLSGSRVGMGCILVLWAVDVYCLASHWTA